MGIIGCIYTFTLVVKHLPFMVNFSEEGNKKETLYTS